MSQHVTDPTRGRGSNNPDVLDLILSNVGRVCRVVERRTFGRGDRGSKPPAAVSKPGQFRSPHFARVFLKRH